MGRHHARGRARLRGRYHRPRLDVRLARRGRCGGRPSRPGGHRPLRVGRALRQRGDDPGGAQRRPPRHRRARGLGGRHRPVGPQGPAARPAPRGPARRGPPGRAGLRQRRLHHLRRRAAGPPAAHLDRGVRHPPGEDQDRRVVGRRGGPRPAQDQRRPPLGRRRGTVRRRQRRLLRQAGGAARRAPRRGGRQLVRGAGLLRRPAGPRPGPRRGALRRRRRRIRLHAGLLRADAGRAGRGLPAGGRHPLRRHHRLAARRGPGRVPRPGDLRPLRPPPARPCRRSGPQPAPPGVVPRPRAHRAAALHRRARPFRRRDPPRHYGRPGPRHGAARTGRGGLQDRLTGGPGRFSRPGARCVAG
ncbi:hypothetical protein SBRY_40310 [Actinacidiphila bryophytorum]|uniref:Uncharacterized protein n=1 Tax=Actinacidiphila bryophytorum TaxID=1436133 RepID=A0A9W4MI40_9ACTN|nr:hypothetical protein SBRY_40310 [Actinacidiphila bryophytorum]